MAYLLWGTTANLGKKHQCAMFPQIHLPDRCSGRFVPLFEPSANTCPGCKREKRWEEKGEAIAGAVVTLISGSDNHEWEMSGEISPRGGAEGIELFRCSIVWCWCRCWWVGWLGSGTRRHSRSNKLGVDLCNDRSWRRARFQRGGEQRTIKREERSFLSRAWLK